MIAKTLNYAKTQGYLRPAVDIDAVVDFMSQFVQERRISATRNSSEYARKMSELSFTFLRGLMTTETIVRYEQKEEEFRQIMKKINETYK